MMKHALAALLFVSCAAQQPQQVVDEPVTEVTTEQRAYAQAAEALKALPSCAAGVLPTPIELAPTFCTRMACTTACCNRCGWKASAGDEAVDLARALQLPEGALDCEIQAWRQAIEGHSLFLGAGEEACVAR